MNELPQVLYLTTAHDPEPVRLEWDGSAWVGSRARGRYAVVDPWGGTIHPEE